MRHSFQRTFLATLFAGSLASTALAASDPHIRGEIASIDGAVHTVRTASGQTIEITLAADAKILLYTPLDLAEIKAGDYLGIASGPASGSTKRALSVILFPEAMRGLNEGDAAWDLVPGSRMTNATLAEVETTAHSGSLTVSHGGMVEEIMVPDGTPVVTFSLAQDRRIEIGEQAIFFARETASGFTAGLVGVSADGSLPPL